MIQFMKSSLVGATTDLAAAVQGKGCRVVFFVVATRPLSRGHASFPPPMSFLADRATFWADGSSWRSLWSFCARFCGARRRVNISDVIDIFCCYRFRFFCEIIAYSIRVSEKKSNFGLRFEDESIYRTYDMILF